MLLLLPAQLEAKRDGPAVLSPVPERASLTFLQLVQLTLETS